MDLDLFDVASSVSDNGNQNETRNKAKSSNIDLLSNDLLTPIQSTDLEDFITNTNTDNLFNKPEISLLGVTQNSSDYERTITDNNNTSDDTQTIEQILQSQKCLNDGDKSMNSNEQNNVAGSLLDLSFFETPSGNETNEHQVLQNLDSESFDYFNNLPNKQTSTKANVDFSELNLFTLESEGEILSDSLEKDNFIKCNSESEKETNHGNSDDLLGLFSSKNEEESVSNFTGLDMENNIFTENSLIADFDQSKTTEMDLGLGVTNNLVPVTSTENNFTDYENFPDKQTITQDVVIKETVDDIINEICGHETSENINVALQSAQGDNKHNIVLDDGVTSHKNETSSMSLVSANNAFSEANGEPFEVKLVQDNISNDLVCNSKNSNASNQGSDHVLDDNKANKTPVVMEKYNTFSSGPSEFVTLKTVVDLSDNTQGLSATKDKGVNKNDILTGLELGNNFQTLNNPQLSQQLNCNYNLANETEATNYHGNENITPSINNLTFHNNVNSAKAGDITNGSEKVEISKDLNCADSKASNIQVKTVDILDNTILDLSSNLNEDIKNMDLLVADKPILNLKNSDADDLSSFKDEQIITDNDISEDNNTAEYGGEILNKNKAENKKSADEDCDCEHNISAISNTYDSNISEISVCGDDNKIFIKTTNQLENVDNTYDSFGGANKTSYVARRTLKCDLFDPEEILSTSSGNDFEQDLGNIPIVYEDNDSNTLVSNIKNIDNNVDERELNISQDSIDMDVLNISTGSYLKLSTDVNNEPDLTDVDNTAENEEKLEEDSTEVKQKVALNVLNTSVENREVMALKEQKNIDSFEETNASSYVIAETSFKNNSSSATLDLNQWESSSDVSNKSSIDSCSAVIAVSDLDDFEEEDEFATNNDYKSFNFVSQLVPKKRENLEEVSDSDPPRKNLKLTRLTMLMHNQRPNYSSVVPSSVFVDPSMFSDDGDDSNLDSSEPSPEADEDEVFEKVPDVKDDPMLNAILTSSQLSEYCDDIDFESLSNQNPEANRYGGYDAGWEDIAQTQRIQTLPVIEEVTEPSDNDESDSEPHQYLSSDMDADSLNPGSLIEEDDVSETVKVSSSDDEDTYSMHSNTSNKSFKDNEPSLAMLSADMLSQINDVVNANNLWTNEVTDFKDNIDDFKDNTPQTGTSTVSPNINEEFSDKDLFGVSNENEIVKQDNIDVIESKEDNKQFEPNIQCIDNSVFSEQSNTATVNKEIEFQLSANSADSVYNTKDKHGNVNINCTDNAENLNKLSHGQDVIKDSVHLSNIAVKPDGENCEKNLSNDQENSPLFINNLSQNNAEIYSVEEENHIEQKLQSKVLSSNYITENNQINNNNYINNHLENKINSDFCVFENFASKSPTDDAIEGLMVDNSIQIDYKAKDNHTMLSPQDNDGNENCINFGDVVSNKMNSSQDVKEVMDNEIMVMSDFECSDNESDENIILPFESNNNFSLQEEFSMIEKEPEDLQSEESSKNSENDFLSLEPEKNNNFNKNIDNEEVLDSNVETPSIDGSVSYNIEVDHNITDKNIDKVETYHNIEDLSKRKVFDSDDMSPSQLHKNNLEIPKVEKVENKYLQDNDEFINDTPTISEPIVSDVGLVNIGNAENTSTTESTNFFVDFNDTTPSSTMPANSQTVLDDGDKSIKNTNLQYSENSMDLLLGNSSVNNKEPLQDNNTSLIMNNFEKEEVSIDFRFQEENVQEKIPINTSLSKQQSVSTSTSQEEILLFNDIEMHTKEESLIPGSTKQERNVYEEIDTVPEKMDIDSKILNAENSIMLENQSVKRKAPSQPNTNGIVVKQFVNKTIKSIDTTQDNENIVDIGTSVENQYSDDKLQDSKHSNGNGSIEVTVSCLKGSDKYLPQEVDAACIKNDSKNSPIISENKCDEISNSTVDKNNHNNQFVNSATDISSEAVNDEVETENFNTLHKINDDFGYSSPKGIILDESGNISINLDMNSKYIVPSKQKNQSLNTSLASNNAMQFSKLNDQTLLVGCIANDSLETIVTQSSDNIDKSFESFSEQSENLDNEVASLKDEEVFRKRKAPLPPTKENLNLDIQKPDAKEKAENENNLSTSSLIDTVQTGNDVDNITQENINNIDTEKVDEIKDNAEVNSPQTRVTSDVDFSSYPVTIVNESTDSGVCGFSEFQTSNKTERILSDSLDIETVSSDKTIDEISDSEITSLEENLQSEDFYIQNQASVICRSIILKAVDIVCEKAISKEVYRIVENMVKKIELESRFNTLHVNQERILGISKGFVAELIEAASVNDLPDQNKVSIPQSNFLGNINDIKEEKLSKVINDFLNDLMQTAKQNVISDEVNPTITTDNIKTSVDKEDCKDSKNKNTNVSKIISGFVTELFEIATHNASSKYKHRSTQKSIDDETLPTLKLEKPNVLNIVQEFLTEIFEDAAINSLLTENKLTSLPKKSNSYSQNKSVKVSEEFVGEIIETAAQNAFNDHNVAVKVSEEFVGEIIETATQNASNDHNEEIKVSDEFVSELIQTAAQNVSNDHNEAVKVSEQFSDELIETASQSASNDHNEAVKVSKEIVDEIIETAAQNALNDHNEAVKVSEEFVGELIETASQNASNDHNKAVKISLEFVDELIETAAQSASNDHNEGGKVSKELVVELIETAAQYVSNDHNEAVKVSEEFVGELIETAAQSSLNDHNEDVKVSEEFLCELIETAAQNASNDHNEAVKVSEEFVDELFETAAQTVSNDLNEAVKVSEEFVDELIETAAQIASNDHNKTVKVSEEFVDELIETAAQSASNDHNEAGKVSEEFVGELIETAAQIALNDLNETDKVSEEFVGELIETATQNASNDHNEAVKVDEEFVGELIETAAQYVSNDHNEAVKVSEEFVDEFIETAAQSALNHHNETDKVSEEFVGELIETAAQNASNDHNKAVKGSEEFVDELIETAAQSALNDHNEAVKGSEEFVDELIETAAQSALNDHNKTDKVSEEFVGELIETAAQNASNNHNKAVKVSDVLVGELIETAAQSVSNDHNEAVEVSVEFVDELFETAAQSASNDHNEAVKGSEEFVAELIETAAQNALNDRNEAVKVIEELVGEPIETTVQNALEEQKNLLKVNESREILEIKVLPEQIPGVIEEEKFVNKEDEIFTEIEDGNVFKIIREFVSDMIESVCLNISVDNNNLPILMERMSSLDICDGPEDVTVSEKDVTQEEDIIIQDKPTRPTAIATIPLRDPDVSSSSQEQSLEVENGRKRLRYKSRSETIDSFGSLDFLTDSEPEDDLGSTPVDSLSSELILDDFPSNTVLDTDFTTSGRPVTLVSKKRKSLVAPTSLLYSPSTDASLASLSEFESRRMSDASQITLESFGSNISNNNFTPTDEKAFTSKDPTTSQKENPQASNKPVIVTNVPAADESIIIPICAMPKLKRPVSWEQVTINNIGYKIDGTSIQPYKKIISHGGFYDNRKTIIELFACYMPEMNIPNYQWVIDNLLLYVLATLELLAQYEYSIVLFVGSTSRSRLPTNALIRRWHQHINHKLRKNMEAIYIVQPSLYVKTVIGFTKMFVSRKAFKKVKYVKSMSDLKTYIPTDFLFIPDVLSRSKESSNLYKETKVNSNYHWTWKWKQAATKAQGTAF